MKITQNSKGNGVWLSLSLFLLLAVFSFSLAKIASVSAKDENSEELVDCNQYFRYGSVKINVKSEPFDYKPGNTVKFSGFLVNENDYPIVDGKVYVKIYLRDPRKGDADNGDFEVAEFVASEKVNLGAKQKKEIEFSYKIPQGTSEGEYLAQVFFDVAGKYNLSGMPFHVSAPGGVANFTVSSLEKNAIFFNKDSVKVNGKDYLFRAINSSVEKESDIVISVPLENPTSRNVSVTVRKDLYFWDALDENNKIKTETEKIELPAGSKREVNYTILKANRSVYFLKISAKSESGESVIGIRPTVKDVFSPRLSYSGIASFPFSQGKKSVIFACFHNTAVGSNEDGKGKLELFLRDGQGKIIAQKKYEGKISGAMMAVATQFSADKNYGETILSSNLYNEKGELVDQAEHKFDCNRFSPSICKDSPKDPNSPVSVPYPVENGFVNTETPAERVSSASSTSSTDSGNWLNYLVVFVMIALMGGVVWWYRRNKREF